MQKHINYSKRSTLTKISGLRLNNPQMDTLIKTLSPQIVSILKDLSNNTTCHGVDENKNNDLTMKFLEALKKLIIFYFNIRIASSNRIYVYILRNNRFLTSIGEIIWTEGCADGHDEMLHKLPWWRSDSICDCYT